MSRLLLMLALVIALLPWGAHAARLAWAEPMQTVSAQTAAQPMLKRTCRIGVLPGGPCADHALLPGMLAAPGGRGSAARFSPGRLNGPRHRPEPPERPPRRI